MKTALGLLTRQSSKLFAIAALVCSASQAFAMNPGERVDNFKLTDADGKSHELYSLAGTKAVVIMVQGNGCPIVRQAVPALREIRDHFKGQGVEFLLMNSNLQDNRTDTAQESKEFEFGLPILMDESQLIGESLGVTRTAEVFVINPKDWKLMYRGPIADGLSYEKQRPAQNHYLQDALTSVLAGKPVKESQVLGVGCLVNIEHHDQRAKR